MFIFRSTQNSPARKVSQPPQQIQGGKHALWLFHSGVSLDHLGAIYLIYGCKLIKWLDQYKQFSVPGSVPKVVHTCEKGLEIKFCAEQNHITSWLCIEYVWYKFPWNYNNILPIHPRSLPVHPLSKLPSRRPAPPDRLPEIAIHFSARVSPSLRFSAILKICGQENWITRVNIKHIRKLEITQKNHGNLRVHTPLLAPSKKWGIFFFRIMVVNQFNTPRLISCAGWLFFKLVDSHEKRHCPPSHSSFSFLKSSFPVSVKSRLHFFRGGILSTLSSGNTSHQWHYTGSLTSPYNWVVVHPTPKIKQPGFWAQKSQSMIWLPWVNLAYCKLCTLTKNISY